MLAIIIINYNKYEKTFECIDTIKRSNCKDYIIYLLDNASTNNSYEILKKRYDNDNQIKLIKSTENVGYANGNNLCIEYAEKDGCKYALISNNDILYEKNTINELYKEIQKGEYLIIGPKVIHPDGKLQISNKLKCPKFIDYIKNETYINRFFKDSNYTINKQCVYWIAGCAFIVNLEKFKKIDYFDKNTFLYYEEYIIAEKAQKNNMKILYNPNIQVIHHHGASMGNVNVNVYLAHLQSELYFWKKYKKLSNVKIKILIFIRRLEIKISLKKRKRMAEYEQYRLQSNKIFEEIVNCEEDNENKN